MLAFRRENRLYTIAEHKHRYNAWAASRAASTKSCRFEVSQGKEIIEAFGLHQLISDPNTLPTPVQIDTAHREWRNTAIAAATGKSLNDFSHGIAAKLINVYLKGVFVCGGHEGHANVAALHPPIDSLLLNELYSRNVGGLRAQWGIARKLRWSKFTSTQYENVITAIRLVMGTSPLWKVEEYWRGYQ